MRHLLLTHTTLLAVASVGLAAPRLKDRAHPAGYYLTTKGATWVMMDDRLGDRTFVVTGVKPTDDGTLVDVGQMEGGKVSPCQQMLVSEKGVFRLSVGGGTFVTPECLLKLPHRDEQTWEFELNPGQGLSKLKAVRREQIEVLAGKFDAIRVEREGEATYWFVEGIGLVKVAYSGGDSVMKSFSPGK